MPESNAIITAGFASRPINPPTGLPLAGFPSERPNTGGDIDLCARAAVFANPDADAPAAAVIVLDNLGVAADIVAKIRQATSEAVAGLDAANIMLAATHTHSAPGLRPYGGVTPGKAPAVNPGYVEQIVAACAAVTADAWSTRRPVTMRVGCASVDAHHNRRVLDEAGKATNVWLDPDNEHTGFKRPDVPFVIFTDAETDATAGMIVSYGCHPVTMGPENVKTSPDYPGYFVRALEETPGGTAIHITGAGGDINPRAALCDSNEQARWLGATLAEAVREKMTEAATTPAGPVRSASVKLKLQLGPDARANFSNRAVESTDGRTLATEVQAIRLGDWCLVSAPGELFAQIGLAMEQAAPTPAVMVAAYANDYLGYLFTDAALAEGGYEPSNAISLNIEKPLVAAAIEAMAATMR